MTEQSSILMVLVAALNVVLGVYTPSMVPFLNAGVLVGVIAGILWWSE